MFILGFIISLILLLLSLYGFYKSEMNFDHSRATLFIGCIALSFLVCGILMKFIVK
ncbi:TPA: hypothetical protein ACN4VG_002387 [Staphylococcus aureus]